MREEMIYVANDGLKFTSKEECLAHDKQIDERDAVKREKEAAFAEIKEKCNAIAEDIKNYEAKYKEPVTLYTNGLPVMPGLVRSFFDLL